MVRRSVKKKENIVVVVLKVFCEKKYPIIFDAINQEEIFLGTLIREDIQTRVRWLMMMRFVEMLEMG